MARPDRAPPSPRDTHITIYGRRPVLEAIADDRLTVDRVIIADNARGDSLAAIELAAHDHHIEIRRRSATQVKLIAGNGRHDQGVAADVLAPKMRRLTDFVEDFTRGGSDPSLLILDGVTNPANVGMILRTATAAGLDGVVLPSAGVAALGPLVIKASAGVAFRAPILRCATAAEALEALTDAGIVVYALAGDRGERLADAQLAPAAAYLLGNETTGVDPALHDFVSGWLSIPLHGVVESLNVASAAAVLAYELERRRN